MIVGTNSIETLGGADTVLMVQYHGDFTSAVWGMEPLYLWFTIFDTQIQPDWIRVNQIMHCSNYPIVHAAPASLGGKEGPDLSSITI